MKIKATHESGHLVSADGTRCGSVGARIFTGDGAPAPRVMSVDTSPRAGDVLSPETFLRAWEEMAEVRATGLSPSEIRRKRMPR